MSTVSSVSSTSGTTDTSTASRVPQKQLGEQDFLKLLATQFQAQDPLKPVDDTAFIAQMAQFSSLQAATDTNTQITTMHADQQKEAANTYIGHRVTVDDGSGNGTTVTGDVTAVDDTGDSPALIINGGSYSLSSVLRVEPGSVTTTPASTTTGS